MTEELGERVNRNSQLCVYTYNIINWFLQANATDDILHSVLDVKKRLHTDHQTSARW